MAPIRRNNKTDYEKWQEERASRKPVLAERLIPQTSEDRNWKPSVSNSKGYQWEKDLLGDVKGKSYNDKFDKVMDSMGIAKHDRMGFRNYLDDMENSEERRRNEVNPFENYWPQYKKEPKHKENLENLVSDIQKVKPKQNTFLQDITTPLKNFGNFAKQSLNPTDGINPYEAWQQNMLQNVQDSAATERSGITNELGRGTSRILDTATLGALSNIDKRVNGEQHQAFQPRQGGGNVADIAYDSLGYLIPGAGAYKAVGTLGKGATGARRLGVEAGKGAGIGGVLAGAEVGIREGINPDDYSAQQNLTHLGIGVGAGAIADPLLYGAGKGVQSLLRRLRGADTPTPQVDAPSQKTIDDVAEQVVSTTETPRIQPNEWLQFGQQSSNIPKARFQQPDIRVFEDANAPGGIRQTGYWRKRYEDFVQHVNSNYDRNQLTQESLEDAWSQFARPDEDVNLEQLIDLYGKDMRRIQEDIAPRLQFGQTNKPQARIQTNQGTLDNALVERLTNLNNKPQTENISSRNIEPSLNRISREQVENISAFKDDGVPMQLASTVEAKPKIDHSKGNAETFKDKVDRSPKKEKSQFFQTMRTQFIDDVAPLENLEKLVAGKVESAENSLYKQARLAKGSPEKADLIVKEQLHPIIRDVQTQGKTLEDLGDYALAVHARDVNGKGINSGFTNKEIEDVIQKLGTPEMEAARKKLVAVNNSVLDMLSTGDSPVLSPADVKKMREKWPNYMSLFRSFDDDKVEFASGLSNALSVASSPIKRLEGSSRRVIDPMESVVKNIYKATSVADRNNAASKLGRLANIDKEGKYVRKLADGEDAGRINVISVMKNGKKERYEVPPDVYKAMKSLDKESSITLIEFLQKPASTLRAGATLTPEFSLRNWIRDVPQAYVVSNSGFNPFVDFPVGLWQSIWKGRTIKIGGKEFKTSGDTYKEFIKENGGYGNIISMDRNLHRETLKKALTEANTSYVDVLSPKTYKALLKQVANPLNVLRKVADISESATKVGEFRAAKRQGASPQEAAYRARDIMDFARAGVSIREANKVVAFLNANIQGKSKLWRAFKDNPVKVTGKAFTAVTMPTIAAIVAQETLSNDKQREVLDDAPQWLKDTFFLVPIPGTDQIARIPKPFDLAYPFSNLVERAFDFVKKHDKEAFDGFVKQSISASAVPVMLTGLSPFVEGMFNHSFFMQSQIIPQREQDLEFPQQYDINTSEVAKITGKGVNAITGGEGAFKNFGSPRIIDNTIRGLTGGLGQYTTNAIDLLLEGTGLTDNPEKPDKLINQQPVLRAFLVNQGSTGESVGKLYDMLDKLKKQRNTAKELDKTFTEESKYKMVSDVTKEISKISKEMREVENSTSLKGNEKRKQLDDLNKQRNELARQTVKRLQ